MSLQNLMSLGLDMFFNTDDFAQTVSYNSEEIPAIFNDNGDHHEHYSDLRTAELTVKVSDVPSPKYRDEVEIDSVIWRVSDIISQDDLVCMLEIQTDEKPRVSEAK